MNTKEFLAEIKDCIEEFLDSNKINLKKDKFEKIKRDFSNKILILKDMKNPPKFDKDLKFSPETDRYQTSSYSGIELFNDKSDGIVTISTSNQKNVLKEFINVQIEEIPELVNLLVSIYNKQM